MIRLTISGIDFYFLYDFLIDGEKRKNHLNSLSEEDKLQEDNIIINNIEVINLINESLNGIDLYNENFEDRERYKKICKTILDELIPQLKGHTKSLKNELRYKASRMLSFL